MFTVEMRLCGFAFIVKLEVIKCVVRIIAKYYFMLTEEKAKQYKVESSYGLPVESPAFKSDGCIWNKKGPLLQHNHKNTPSKRFEFRKIGKTMGFETRRYLTIKENYLLYYDDANSDKILGYCELQNIYVYFLRTSDQKFILYLTNGSSSSQFFFDNEDFFYQMRPRVQRSIIQLNFSDKYMELDLLGQGSFSKVYLVKKYCNSHKFAAKVVSKKDKHDIPTKQCVSQEKKILCRLNHCQYIYQIQQFFQEEDNFIFIIEYLTGKDMMSLIKQKTDFTSDQKIDLLWKILEALAYCHSQNVIHRDLKPQNIIVNLIDNRPKLIDFGLSLLVAPGINIQEYRRCGTMGYMAPQVFENAGTNRKVYDAKCDVFSYGIIAHMLLMGSNPLKGKNYDETYNKNKACIIKLDQPAIVNKYGPSCVDFFMRILDKNPKTRFTASQVLGMNFFKRESSESTNYKTKWCDSTGVKSRPADDFEIEPQQQQKNITKLYTQDVNSSRF